MTRNVKASRSKSKLVGKSRPVGREKVSQRDVRHLRTTPRTLRPALQSPRRVRPVEEEGGVGTETVEARAEGTTTAVGKRNGLMVYASAAGTRYVIQGSRREIEIFVPSNSYGRIVEDIRGVKFKSAGGK